MGERTRLLLLPLMGCLLVGCMANAPETDSGILGKLGNSQSDKENLLGSLAASPPYPKSGESELRKEAIAAGLIKPSAAHGKKNAFAKSVVKKVVSKASVETRVDASAPVGAAAAAQAGAAMAAKVGKPEALKAIQQHQNKELLFAEVPQEGSDGNMVVKDGVVQGVEAAVMDLTKDIRMDDEKLAEKDPLASLADEQRLDEAALEVSHPKITFPTFSEELAEKPMALDGSKMERRPVSVHDALANVRNAIDSLGTVGPIPVMHTTKMVRVAPPSGPYDPQEAHAREVARMSAEAGERQGAFEDTKAAEKADSTMDHAAFISSVLSGRKDDAMERSAAERNAVEHRNAMGAVDSAFEHAGSAEKKALAMEEGRDEAMQKHFAAEMDAVADLRAKMIVSREGRDEELREEAARKLAHHSIRDLALENEKLHQIQTVRKQDDAFGAEVSQREHVQATAERRGEEAEERREEAGMRHEADAAVMKARAKIAEAEHAEAERKLREDHELEKHVSSRKERFEKMHALDAAREEAQKAAARNAEKRALEVMAERRSKEEAKQALRRKEMVEQEAAHQEKMEEKVKMSEKRAEIKTEHLRAIANEREKQYAQALAKDETSARVHAEERKGEEMAAVGGVAGGKGSVARAEDEVVMARAAKEREEQAAKLEAWHERSEKREAVRADLVAGEQREHAERLAEEHAEQERKRAAAQAAEEAKVRTFEEQSKARAARVSSKQQELKAKMGAKMGEVAKQQQSVAEQRDRLHKEYSEARHSVLVTMAALRLAKKQLAGAHAKLQFTGGQGGEALASHQNAVAMLEEKEAREVAKQRKIEHELYLVGGV